MGIVTQLTEDIDLFSPEGRPLRAKVVRDDEGGTSRPGGQKRSGRRRVPATTPTPAWEAESQQRRARVRRPPAIPIAAAPAQSGESLQQLLARLGADPAAWRAAMPDWTARWRSPAGAQVQLAAGASAELGVGATAGFAAGGRLTGSGGSRWCRGGERRARGRRGCRWGCRCGCCCRRWISAVAEVTATGAGPSAAGFVLAEGGGVVAATRTVIAAQAQASIASARAAFEVPAAGIAVQARGREVETVDPRTQSFGRGIPLRPRPKIIDP